MKNILTSIKAFALAHKITSGVVLIVVLGGGYYAYGKLTSTDGETRYVLSAVQKQTIVASITGSGQVATENQVDLKPKVSGDVLSITIVQGGSVKAGQPILYLDAVDAQKTVRDAEANLESARIALQKLKQPADELSLTQSQNSLDRAKESEENAKVALVKAYNDAFNSISNAFLDFPGVMTGLRDTLFNTNSALGGTNVQNIDFYTNTAELYSPKATDYGRDAYDKYQIALTKYNKNFANFKDLSRAADNTLIESTLAQTYDTAIALSDAIKSASNLIQFYEDQITQHNLKYPTVADTQLATLNTYTGKVTSRLTDLLGQKSTIQSDKDAIMNAARNIDESAKSLARLQAGADPLDVQTSMLSLTQRQNTLIDAQHALADYTVRAPFDGVIARLNSKKGDSASPSTIIATLVTTQKIAQISLNEVDAAKIKVGQKATLTFDAVAGLAIAAQVADIDTVGTVSQGVVTYSVKLSFETQDERVKSGMSVSAAIVTDVKQDVLAVPAAAVKVTGNTSYVEMLDGVSAVASGGTQGVTSAIPPRQQNVEVGFSNDTLTEIISGTKEGDLVVTRTISATTPAAAAPSLFGGGGNRVIRN